MEDIPRIDSEPTGDHQRHRRAVEPQPDVQRSEPGWESATAEGTKRGGHDFQSAHDWIRWA